MRKSAGEVDGAAPRPAPRSTACTPQVAQWLRPGRTEREVGADIADAILAAGHATVDFVIVGSGPNGASPHHELSDRVIQAGDPVVVDIGGTMPEGYCSTRPGPTPSASRPPSSWRTTTCCRRRRRLPASMRRGRASPPSRSTRRRATSSSAAGYGELLHPPHRPRHRAGDARGAVHRRRQHRAARAGHGVLDRAGHLPRGPHGARIEDIVVVHRGRRRGRAAQPAPARARRRWTPEEATPHGADRRP